MKNFIDVFTQFDDQVLEQVSEQVESQIRVIDKSIIISEFINEDIFNIDL